MGYTITTRSKTISTAFHLYATGVCQQCKNPYIHDLTIRSEESKAVGLFYGKSDEKEMATVHNRCMKAAGIVERYLTNRDAELFPTAIPNVEIEGFENPCPFCGAVQKWQKKDDTCQVNEGEPGNGVRVFDDLASAYFWAQQFLVERKRKADKLQEDQEFIQLNKKKIAESEEIIRKLSEERKRIESQCSLVCEEYRKKENELAQSMVGRIVIGKKKQAILEEIEKNRKAREDEEQKAATSIQEYDKQLACENDRLKEVKLISQHFSGKAVFVENEHGIALALHSSEAYAYTGIIAELEPLPFVGIFEKSIYETDDVNNTIQVLKANMGEEGMYE